MTTRRTEKYTFFFTQESPFSQWFSCQFTVDGHAFNCAEQFMMHGKAKLFRDADIAAEILAAVHPREHKAFGRKVKDFDGAVWNRERMTLVKAGNRAKFTQNPALLEQLLATAPTTLVEASPFDRIWGIGLSATHADAENPAKWRGQNLLGIVLTELRAELATSRP